MLIFSLSCPPHPPTRKPTENHQSVGEWKAKLLRKWWLPVHTPHYLVLVISIRSAVVCGGGPGEMGHVVDKTRVEREENKLRAVPSGVSLTLELVAVVVVVVVLVWVCNETYPTELVLCTGGRGQNRTEQRTFLIKDHGHVVLYSTHLLIRSHCSGNLYPWICV